MYVRIDNLISKGLFNDYQRYIYSQWSSQYYPQRYLCDHHQDYICSTKEYFISLKFISVIKVFSSIIHSTRPNKQLLLEMNQEWPTQYLPAIPISQRSSSVAWWCCRWCSPRWRSCCPWERQSGLRWQRHLAEYPGDLYITVYTYTKRMNQTWLSGRMNAIITDKLTQTIV